jgi:hypothetical protein
MARYTGPKQELLVNLATIFEMTKHSKEEVTHLDNGMAKKRGKKSEYTIQLMESKS